MSSVGARDLGDRQNVLLAYKRQFMPKVTSNIGIVEIQISSPVHPHYSVSDREALFTFLKFPGFGNILLGLFGPAVGQGRPGQTGGGAVTGGAGNEGNGGLGFFLLVDICRF